MTVPKEQASRVSIPEFQSIEEEAAFWDTHETTDFEAAFKPVKVRFAKRLSEGLHIRLDWASSQELRSIAAEKGVGPSTLARMWVLEHLRRELTVSKPGSRAGH